MSDDPIRRREFDGYVRRHESDLDAHAPLIRRLQAEGLSVRALYDTRLTALERWQQRIIGGMMFAAFILGGGGLATVIELVRK